jgi:phosphate uptake regulator
MVRRKIVKQGAATMMISLPAKWIKKNNLHKGDEIDIEEKGNSLLIQTEQQTSKKETEINIGSLTESSIRVIITNCYRLGYNKIKINFNNPDAIKIISDVIGSNLIGFEITKKSEKSCEIENITEPSKEQFDNIFSKILLNIEELFDIAEQNLKGEKLEFLDTENKIQQFDNFCRRVIIKQGFDEDSQLKWLFHSELNHGQREIFHMLKYIEKNKIKSDNEILNLLKESKNMFNLLKQAYNEKSIPKLEKMHESEKELIYKKAYSLFNKNKNSIIIHHLTTAIRSFYLASSPLIGLLIKKS